MAFRNHVIGVIRFSFPGLNSYRKTPDTAAEAEAFVYAPERLERRVHLFEKLCLPSLLHQTDPDYTVVLLIGDNLPPAYRARLEELTRPLRSCLIYATGPRHAYVAVKEAYAAGARDGYTHRTSFRLDDDDALCTRYVERLKRRADLLHQPDDPDAPFAIGFNKGFYLAVSPEGNKVFDVVERLPLGLGLSLTTPYGSRLNVYKYHHRRIATACDFFSDARQPAFIRTVHRDNDSGMNLNGVRGTLTPVQVPEVLEREFPFGLDHLMSV
ncbi:MAG: glycosyltransferase [Rhodobacter sp.]|nr:glycosyltransferase [Rhodobacter sp.]